MLTSPQPLSKGEGTGTDYVECINGIIVFSKGLIDLLVLTSPFSKGEGTGKDYVYCINVIVLF